jgi:hypothetical protein
MRKSYEYSIRNHGFEFDESKLFWYHRSFMSKEVLKLGGNVDSWCGKCKMMLAHTIEALVDNKPVRVVCNTCQAQHGYRPNIPNEPSRPARQRATSDGAAGPALPRTRGNRYQVLLKGKDMTLAKSYSIKDSYAPGDVLQHPSFGLGIATAVKDGAKVEVLFETGTKVLVHGR